MKHLPKMIALVAIALLALASCNAFVFGTNDLKGTTLTYSMDLLNGSAMNGHDTTTLVFDDTGTAGVFTTALYTYDYATAADYASADYSKKSWFQNGGRQGSFTYDPDTGAFSVTIDSDFLPAVGSTPIYGGVYAQADYSYQDLDTYNTASSPGTTYTNTAYVFGSVVEINADQILARYNAGADGTWIASSTNSSTITINAVTFSSSTASTATITFTDGSFTYDVVSVDAITSGTSTTTVNIEDIHSYALLKASSVGKDDEQDAAFTDIWNKGATVTIQIEQTQRDYIWWSDTKPATAPTVSPTTGTGTSGSTSSLPYYFIDKNHYTPEVWTVTHTGDYIVTADSSIYAARGMASK
jgi:hypothetical protein